MTMMNTNTSALMAANQQAYQIPFYSDIMTNRPAKKHRVFEIGNGIFFEYWNKSNWEFTVVNKDIDMREWTRTARQVVIDIECMNPTSDKLHRIVKLAKKRFAQYL